MEPQLETVHLVPETETERTDLTPTQVGIHLRPETEAADTTLRPAVDTTVRLRPEIVESES